MRRHLEKEWTPAPGPRPHARQSAARPKRAPEPPPVLQSSNLQSLQRSAGNSAVCQLLAGEARATTGKDHRLQLGSLMSGVERARSTSAPSLPPALRQMTENATGRDLSDVRVHDDPSAWALNGELDTAAFASGRDIFFRKAAYDPLSPRGAALVDHELGHVVEGKAGAHGATSIDRARVRVAVDRDYRVAAQTFETKLGPYLSKMDEPNEIADIMLGRLRQIVDAWAEAARIGKKKVYQTEFDFPTGTKYYGSFVITAKQVKRVFEKKDQPLRKKLNLVYYATRNGNLAKYLEVAAHELQLAHDAGTAKANQDVGVSSDTFKGEVSLRGGFAKQSGIEDRWKSAPKPLAGKSSKEEVEADLATRLAKAKKEKKDTPTLGGSGAASSMGPSNKALRGDKRYDTYKGLELEDTQTLTRSDVGDITTAEMRLLYQREERRQPLWLTSRDKAKFRAKGHKRILWEQGGQNIEVAADSETRRIAEATMSRLEGGISGSTDLMMHAAKHLGFSSANELKQLRLALVAWMLSNRDHSFFEIMKVASDYGITFHLDPARPGAEYEDQDNFAPLDQAQVDDFKKLMPNQHMPSYFATGAHKATVKNDLSGSEGTSASAYHLQLLGAGLLLGSSWKSKDKSADLAQWLALRAEVTGLGLQAGHTEADLKANRIKVQALQKDPAWFHLAKASVDPNAASNLRALLSHQFGAGAVVADSDVQAAGVPPAVIAGIEEYKRYDVLRLKRAIEAMAPGMKSKAAHEEGVSQLWRDPAFRAVRHWLGEATAEMVLNAMLAKTLGNAAATATEKADLRDAPKLAAFQASYPTLDGQMAHLVSRGLPRAIAKKVAEWGDGIDKSTRTPTLVLFRLDELYLAVAGAGHQASEPPTSPANQKARKTVFDGLEYRSVRAQMDSALARACVAAFTNKLYGAESTTASEDQAAFGKLWQHGGQLDLLTAAGIPRDLLEGDPELVQPMEALRRAAVDAGFDKSKPATDVANTQAWSDLTDSAAFQTVRPLLDANKTRAKAKAVAYASALVKSQVGAGVLSPDLQMLALASEQRMAREDKARLGVSSNVAATNLPTPALQNETEPSAKKRRERYWASAASAADFHKNVGAAGGAVSPTMKAQLELWTGGFKAAGTLNNEVRRLCKYLATQSGYDSDYRKVRATYFPDTDGPDEKIETFLAIVPFEYAQHFIDPGVKAAVWAIQGLTRHERGAIYQYTNKLHEQLGYATQNFSMSTDFSPTDVANATAKLQSVRFMLPIVQALNSAMEKLPAYGASSVYSGRSSKKNLVTQSDDGRLDYGRKYFPIGSPISYSYPLSTAKDVKSSFLSKGPTYDIALLIAQPVLTGRDIEYLSNKPGEKEVLFPQGVRFQVTALAAQPPAGITVNADTKDKLWVTLKEL